MRASNFVHLAGNLGGAVELRKGEPAVARLSVAETVARFNRETGKFEASHTNWIPVTAFGRLARRAAQTLKKGDRVVIQGSLRSTTYEKDGENRRGFELIADAIEKAQLLPRAEEGAPVEGAAAASFAEFQETEIAL